jgi:hypothetical protein
MLIDGGHVIPKKCNEPLINAYYLPIIIHGYKILHSTSTLITRAPHQLEVQVLFIGLLVNLIALN